MIAGWVAYSLLVSWLLGAAAALAAAGRVGGRGCPSRFAWAAALVGSTLLALAAAAFGPDLVAVRERWWVALWPLAGLSPRLAAAYALIARADGALRWLCPLASALAAAVLLAGAASARARRRSWRRVRLGAGPPVWLSRADGPAAFGVWRADIVLPAWALDLDPAALALVLEHERQHVRARDGVLLALGALALVCAPWNPFAWAHFRRLRAAIELDCDRRVLRATGAANDRYAALLLDVAARSARRPRPAGSMGFGGRRRSELERRLRALLAPAAPRAPARRWARPLGAALALAALGLPYPTGLLCALHRQGGAHAASLLKK